MAAAPAAGGEQKRPAVEPARRVGYLQPTGAPGAMAPDPSRPKNTYVREDKLLPHLSALHRLLTTPAVRARRRTRAGAYVRDTVSPGEVIGYLRAHEITLTWNPAAALQARATETAKTVTVKQANPAAKP